MSNILITGASGYLGGRTAKGLAEAGHSLRLATGSPVAAMPEAVAGLGEVVSMPRGVSLPEGLLEDVDCVVHLAAPNEIRCAADPQLAVVDTVLPTIALLQGAGRAGVGRFIYLSTVHVYGNPLTGELTEDTPATPRHPYAIAHRTAEDFVLSSPEEALSRTVLRLSNSIGAPLHAEIDRWTLLGNDLCRQAVTKGSISLRSTGLDSRDFLPIGDVVDAITHFAGLPPNDGNGIFNLGQGISRRVIDMADRIAQRAGRILDSKPRITVQQGTGEPAPFRINIDKLKAAGFTPTGDLDQAIDETLLFCRDHFLQQGR